MIFDHEDPVVQEIFQTLGEISIIEFALHQMEINASFVLMFHWIRGIFNDMQFHEVVNLNADAKRNYERLHAWLETQEQTVWSLSPPRAVLQMLTMYRLTGFMDIDDLKIAAKDDEHGRVPYGTDPEFLSKLSDLYRRLEDVHEKHRKDNG